MDDDVRPDDASVRLLELEGFRVECASTAADGLKRARAGAYDLMMLDLRLPDMPGLELLRMLRAIGVTTRVMVLTGYGDTDAALTAGSLGVVSFQAKPLMGDDFLNAARAAVLTGSKLIHPMQEAHDASPSEGPEMLVLRALFGRLMSLAAGEEAKAEISASMAYHAGPKGLLIAVLFSSSADADQGLLGFLASAEALKHVHDAAERTPRWKLAAEASQTIGAAIERSRRPVHFKVRVAIARMEHLIVSGVHPAEAAVAADMGVHPSHLGRRLRAELDLDFLQVRRSLALRLGVRKVVHSDEHITQIAHSLGYEWPEQFARDLNGNGMIDNGSELFGSATVKRDGRRARNGFEALVDLDGGSSSDGKVTVADGAYDALRLWLDRNHNGVSERSELVSLRDAGITTVFTAYTEKRRRDRYGNQHKFEGSAGMSR